MRTNVKEPLEKRLVKKEKRRYLCSKQKQARQLSIWRRKMKNSYLGQWIWTRCWAKGFPASYYGLVYACIMLDLSMVGGSAATGWKIKANIDPPSLYTWQQHTCNWGCGFFYQWGLSLHHPPGFITTPLTTRRLPSQHLDPALPKLFWFTPTLPTCPTVAKQFWDTKRTSPDGNIKVANLPSFALITSCMPLLEQPKIIFY
jgi:hypothetical protein